MSNYFKHKLRSKSPIEIVGAILFFIIIGTGLAVLFGFIIMWLWNWLMPELFNLPTVSYWQGVGLFILFKILLGGCNFGSDNKKSSKKNKHRCDDSKGKFSKWEHYDDFWKEEGNKAYENYLERQSQPNNTIEDENTNL